jgi:hypothetical protein
VLGAAVVLLLDGGGDDGRDEVPVTPVAQRAQALGSDLGAPERSVDCRGERPAPGSPSCALVQSELPGRKVIAPADGAIVGWSARGATGEMRLAVIRPRGKETVRVGVSQWESAGNPGPHRFETRLPVEAGDQIGIEMTRGASIGVSDAEGAATQRWLEPKGGAFGSPQRGEGTGFDHEVALRAEFVPREKVGLPEHLTGSAATRAPDGRVRDRAQLAVDKPRPTRLRVELVEVEGRVALDVRSGGRRTVRVFMPDLQPEGVPVELQTVAFPGEAFGEADVWWVNPNSGRMIFHFFNVGDGSLEFAG